MTPSERDRRIKAAVESWITAPGDFVYSRMGAALDAADEAVPMVSEAEMQRRSWIDHEAAARELLDVLNDETMDEDAMESPWGRERRQLRRVLDDRGGAL